MHVLGLKTKVFLLLFAFFFTSAEMFLCVSKSENERNRKLNYALLISSWCIIVIV